MHNLASNNKDSHGVEGSETSLLQWFAGQFSPSQLSAVNLKLRGLLLCKVDACIMSQRVLWVHIQL